MDDDDNFDDIDFDNEAEAEDEFLEFISRLSERNRSRMIREQIERREESRRLGDVLGLEGFELSNSY
jgi:hypothetical protein